MSAVARAVRVSSEAWVTEPETLPRILAAARARNDAIAVAVARFTAARDAAARRLKGRQLADAMHPHERALDAALADAWEAFTKAATE